MPLQLILCPPTTAKDVRREVGPGHGLVVVDPDDLPAGVADHSENPPIVIVAGALPAGELRRIVVALARNTARRHSRAPPTEREHSVLRLDAADRVRLIRSVA